MRERCKIILYLLYFSAKKRMIPSTYLSGFWNIRNCLERAIPATSLLQKQDELTHRTNVKNEHHLPKQIKTQNTFISEVLIFALNI